MPEQRSVVANKKRRISLVWIIPLITLIATGIILWNGLISKGNTIKLYIDSAAGIEAGKTLIKFRSVVVGRVESVNLTEDFKRIEINCVMNAGTEDLLRQDSQFWLVKPTVDAKRISGLETLLSGVYIQIYQGNSENKSQEFECLEEAPVINVAERVGIELILSSKLRKRLEPGDSVKYRGFTVGVVTQSQLNPEDRSVTYHVFIDEPYNKLVTSSSMFWLNSGVDMRLGPEGLRVETENLVNLLTAGVAFDDFDMSYDRLARSGETFKLHENVSSARINSLFYQPKYVVMVQDDLKSIRSGSTVLYRGMKIGEVVAAPWYDDEAPKESLDGSQIPVLFALAPDTEVDHQVKDIFSGELAKQSLYAKINMSLIGTGSSISIMKADEEKDLEDVEVSQTGFPEYTFYRGVEVIPFRQDKTIMDSLTYAAEQVSQLDVAGISGGTKKVLNSLDELLNSLNATAASLNQNRSAEELTKTLQTLRKTLDSIRSVANSFNAIDGIKDSINELMAALKQIIKDLIPAAREVGQNPNSLIFGDKEADPVPTVRGRR